MATAPNPNKVVKRLFEPTALVGQVYTRLYGSNDPLEEIGNVLALELSHSENVETQPNLTRTGGGAYAERRRIESAGISLTLADLNTTNLARAVRAVVTGIDAGNVQGEAFKARLGGLHRTAFIVPKQVVVRRTGGAPGTGTVTDEQHAGVNQSDSINLAHANPADVVVRLGADAGTATVVTAAGNYAVTATGIDIAAAAPGIANGSTLWVSYSYPTAATGAVVPPVGNYEVRAAGIYILPNAADIADDEDLVVDYSHGEQAIIEALTSGVVELELVFEGLNEVGSDGRASIVEIYRIGQSLASAISLIQESGFASLPIEGTILRDPTKTGTGISPYYRVRKT